MAASTRCRSDVARQNRPPCAVLDRHHARPVVVRRDRTGRVHDSEPHAVPLPTRAGTTRPQRVESAYGLPADQRAYRRCVCDRVVTTDVIEIGMAQHHRIENASAVASQVRHHHGRTEVEARRKSWPCVIQQTVSRGLDDRAQSLADIEHRHCELIAAADGIRAVPTATQCTVTAAPGAATKAATASSRTRSKKPPATTRRAPSASWSSRSVPARADTQPRSRRSQSTKWTTQAAASTSIAMSTPATRSSGTTMTLTIGTAIRFASGPTHETLPIVATSTGTIATAKTTCAITSVRNRGTRLDARRKLREQHRDRTERQPEPRLQRCERIARQHGSHAPARTYAASEMRRPSGSTNSTTIVAIHERSTGTPHPARHAYNVTTATPTYTPHQIMPPRASTAGLSRASRSAQRDAERGNDRQVQSGDHHQVNGSGGAKQRPVGVVHQTAVAGQQREIDSRMCKRKRRVLLAQVQV